MSEQNIPNRSQRKTSLPIAPGETNIYEETYTPSLMTPYLMGELMCSSTRFSYKAPNTLLGIFPLGSNDNVIPIRSIAAVSSSAKFRPGKAFLALVLLIVGLAVIGDSPVLGIILLLLCIPLFLTVMPQVLVVTNNAGMAQTITASALDKAKILKFRDALQQRVYADNDAIRHNEAQQLRMQQAMLQQMSLQSQLQANQQNQQRQWETQQMMQNQQQPVTPQQPQMPQPPDIGTV